MVWAFSLFPECSESYWNPRWAWCHPNNIFRPNAQKPRQPPWFRDFRICWLNTKCSRLSSRGHCPPRLCQSRFRRRQRLSRAVGRLNYPRSGLIFVAKTACERGFLRQNRNYPKNGLCSSETTKPNRVVRRGVWAAWWAVRCRRWLWAFCPRAKLRFLSWTANNNRSFVGEWRPLFRPQVADWCRRFASWLGLVTFQFRRRKFWFVSDTQKTIRFGANPLFSDCQLNQAYRLQTKNAARRQSPIPALFVF